MKYLGPPQSGSVSNLTYSHNLFGQYTRDRVGRGGTPATAVTSAVAAWQGLTLEQQEGWNQWSKWIPRPDSLGETRVLSGYQRFISARMLGALVSVTVTSAPTLQSDAAIVDVELTQLSSSIVQMEVAASVTTGAWIQFWFVHRPASTGTKSPPGRNNYWDYNITNALAGGAAQRTVDFSPATGRVWSRVRILRPDWTFGPWWVAGPLTVT